MKLGGKIHPLTYHEDTEGKKVYSATLSLTLALDGVGGERHATLRPGRFTPEMTRYPLYGKLDQSGRVRKNSPYGNAIPGPSNPQPAAIPTNMATNVSNSILPHIIWPFCKMTPQFLKNKSKEIQRAGIF
jgi:hypothetical protein